MNNYEEASLIAIGDGQAIKKFDYELKKAIENCKDPNTDAKSTRKIVLEVKLIPDANRENVAVTYQAKSTLASDSAGEGHMILARDKAYINNSRQLLIDDYENDVTEIEGEGTND